MTLVTLEGKRVLLIAPRFFGYDQDIKAEIERRGAMVDWLPDRPFDTPFMKAVTKLHAELIQPAASRLYERLLNEAGASAYDYILVVNGQTLSGRMLARLRSLFPMAKVILYMWDSMDNRRSVVDNLGYFDAAFTFDPLCAQKHGMTLRPLFFSMGFEQQVTEFDYQISFVGTAHTDRYAVVSELKKALPSNVSAYWYLYLQAPWVLAFYKASRPGMRSARKEDFNFEPLSKTVVQNVFSKSLAILDIEHPNQRGLTMRTFETMGAGKKLVTTNSRVADYDFFGFGNVSVIDRNMPRLSADFLEIPFVPYPEAIRYRYSLVGWVDEVFGVQESKGARQ